MSDSDSFKAKCMEGWGIRVMSDLGEEEKKVYCKLGSSLIVSV